MWEVAWSPARSSCSWRWQSRRAECAAVAVPGAVEIDPAILFPDFLLPIIDGGNVACDCSMPADAGSPVWKTRAEFEVEPVARSLGELVG